MDLDWGRRRFAEAVRAAMVSTSRHGGETLDANRCRQMGNIHHIRPNSGAANPHESILSDLLVRRFRVRVAPFESFRCLLAAAASLFGSLCPDRRSRRSCRRGRAGSRVSQPNGTDPCFDVERKARVVPPRWPKPFARQVGVSQPCRDGSASRLSSGAQQTHHVRNKES